MKRRPALIPVSHDHHNGLVQAVRYPPTERSGVTDPMRARVLGPKDGNSGMLGSMGVRFMLAGEETGGGFALVEHPMPPRALAAPLHRHSREDEYSFVLEGRVGALLGDEVVYGEPGDLIFKPRGQWHTFWNDAGEPARILEMISPAGFEGYFDEMVGLLQQPGSPEPSALAAVAARYGLEVDRESIPRLTQEYGLHFGPPAP
jgi:quercetin dioxygenase-like cupin family protein